MLNSIKIKNFKNIKDEEVGFADLTVLVGANASGKTSVLEAVHYATVAANGDPSKVFNYERHCDWLYTRGGEGEMRLECRTDEGFYGVAAKPASPLGFTEDRDQLGKGEWIIQKIPEDDQKRRRALQPSRSMVFLRLNASNLAKESYAEQNTPRVEFDGSGLASVLAYLKLEDEETFEQIEDYMRKFIPHFQRLRLKKTPVRRYENDIFNVGGERVTQKSTREYQGELILFEFSNAKYLSAHSVSEGTLLLLGLLTVMIGPSQPDVLLMDDIEHGLHPLAQKQLLEVLGTVTKEFFDLQIIASAHSPYLLDGLRAEQIRLVTTNEEGYAIVGKLSDHPEFDKWKDEMAPGEMWSMFGEKWLGEI
ncbi:ATP-binding protein [Rubinisphaera sp.]|uniref:AAA family ATPase n=1 Tax=Rubinisphaera sp. TaxID=2024857 RepID=UPI000C0F842B|nr:ATP-binding protein [Rubinisphaera sp.]MBV08935.1 hypothetical protein [Rubinisphaera sp.]HCS52255.1 hypothetical protein [Planctomycetaceae bacterium]|tara:strand:- start:4019 stop:5110 length:1092 start_codon:yes stop_codon:yes gene_type:complete